MTFIAKIGRLGARAAALALAGAAFASPAMALHGYRATVPVLSLLLVAAIVTALVHRRPPPVDRLLAWVLLALFAWSAASALWSVDPAHSLSSLFRAAILLLGGLAIAAWGAQLAVADSRRVGTALLAGVGVGAALQIFEAATGAVIKDLISDRELPMVAIKAGSTLLAVFVWPAVAVALDRGRPWLAAGLVVAIALPLPFLDGRAAALAVASGAVVLLAGLLAARATAIAIAVGTIVVVLTAPLLYLQLPPADLDAEGGILPFSARHRIEIWRFAVAQVMERPFAGWGFDAARVFPGARRIIDPASGALQMPQHPHSAALQWWLELGAVGAALGSLVIAAVARAALRLPTAAGRAGALATLAAALVMCMVSYSVWRSWWLAGLGLAAAFLTCLRRPRDTQT